MEEDRFQPDQKREMPKMKNPRAINTDDSSKVSESYALDVGRWDTIRWNVPMTQFATNARSRGIWQLNVGAPSAKR
jgi:hypothetical protein